MRNKPFVLWRSRRRLRQRLSQGNFIQPQQQRQRERRETNGLMSRKKGRARAL